MQTETSRKRLSRCLDGARALLLEPLYSFRKWVIWPRGGGAQLEAVTNPSLRSQWPFKEKKKTNFKSRCFSVLSSQQETRDKKGHLSVLLRAPSSEDVIFFFSTRFLLRNRAVLLLGAFVSNCKQTQLTKWFPLSSLLLSFIAIDVTVFNYFVCFEQWMNELDPISPRPVYQFLRRTSSPPAAFPPACASWWTHLYPQLSSFDLVRLIVKTK